MRRLYTDVDLEDELVSPLIRFLAVLERADICLSDAREILDEEGDPHPATDAALEAASAAIVAAMRAELNDDWWEDLRPPVSELPTPLSPVQRMEALAEKYLVPRKPKGGEE